MTAIARTPDERRSIALRRSERPARPPRAKIEASLGDQVLAVGESLYEDLARWVGAYRDYRDELARARELGAQVGGGQRYADDVRRNTWDPERASGRAIRGARRSLREFVRLAPENGVDARRMLRAVWREATYADLWYTRFRLPEEQPS